MAPSVKYNTYLNGAGEESYMNETYLYDPELLSRLTFATSEQKFRPHIPGPMNPGPGLKVRPLSSGDFDRGNIKWLRSFLIQLEFSEIRIHEVHST